MSDGRKLNDSLDSEPSSLLLLLAAHLGEVLGLMMICFVLAGSPVPEVNEPHYLGKAKHYWQPEWCGRDLFLQSADAHHLFVVGFGWVTRFASLETTAWVGRLLAWFALSLGWHRLSWSLVPRWGMSWLSGTLWFVLVQYGQMSGEWILGGVEAKVFAYAFALFGAADIVQARWRSCWLWFGLASAFHVLVGGWAVVAALFAWWRQPKDRRPRLDAMLPFLAMGGVLALPGLFPALALGWNDGGGGSSEAWRIYVFERLRHHLLITSFPLAFVLRHLVLIAAFAVLARSLRTQTEYRRIGAWVLGAILLATIGAIINLILGDSALAASLMRFYWFRSTDVWVPAGVALAVTIWIAYRLDLQARWGSSVFAAILCVLVLNGIWVTWQSSQRVVPPADEQGGISTNTQWQHWKDVCQWVRQNTDEDSLWLTPLRHQTFKWYAQRAELVTWKDVPQDAPSLLKWHERRTEVQSWLDAVELGDDAGATDAWRTLTEKYNYEFCVLNEPWGKAAPQNCLLEYRNAGYSVYRVLPE